MAFYFFLAQKKHFQLNKANYSLGCNTWQGFISLKFWLCFPPALFHVLTCFAHLWQILLWIFWSLGRLQKWLLTETNPSSFALWSGNYRVMRSRGNMTYRWKLPMEHANILPFQYALFHGAGLFQAWKRIWSHCVRETRKSRPLVSRKPVPYLHNCKKLNRNFKGFGEKTL